jgi:nitrogen fixation protein FixH
MSSCRWVPWAIAAGLGIVVLANGALAYFAARSATGLVTEHPFDEGNGYNRVLAAAAAQDRLGWRQALHFLDAGNARGELVIELTDRAGKPVSGLTVTARLVRPVDALPETDLELAETAPGRYAAAATLPRRGQWEVQGSAGHAADVFEFSQRIVVK